MENYKEKYEMALEGVQEILSSGQDSIKMSQLALRLHGIFPELAESEDEKIRKTIIRFFKDNYPNETEMYDGSVTVGKAIAWLEKQKSVGEIVERCKNSWYNEGKITGMAEGLTEDEKYQQGWHDALEKQGEQKQEWSDEDDERIRKELIKVFSNREKYLIDQSFGDITVSEALAWLKKQEEQKPIISIACMVNRYASTPEQGNEGFGKPMNCMVRAYRQGILDTLKKIRQNNVVEEQQNITEQESQKFVTEDKSLSDKHQWEDGDIIRLKNDDGVRWQIFKSPESEMREEWFMSQIMENGIAGGYVSSFILDTKYEFLYNPHKEFLKKH